MGWIDRHKRCGTVLALVALALQIVVGFDHVHVHGLAHHSHGPVVQHSATAQPASQAPARNQGHDDDYCAICASIFLASSAFAPTPPQLPLPAGFQPVGLSFEVAQPLIEPLRLAFRSRAPPQA
jgi:hypothetical protein